MCDGIARGKPVAMEDHGYYVTMCDLFNGASICGGTLISDQYIITAGHCADNSETTTFCLGDPRRGEGVRAVSRLVKTLYPNGADIKLMKLVTPVKFTDSIYPARLPQEDDCKGGTPVTATGHGQMIGRKDDNTLPDIAHYDSATILEICPDIFRKNEICTTHVTCQGDSGGPYVKGHGKDAIVVGLNAHGPPIKAGEKNGCDHDEYDGVTNVCFHRQWILDGMDSKPIDRTTSSAPITRSTSSTPKFPPINTTPNTTPPSQPTPSTTPPSNPTPQKPGTAPKKTVAPWHWIALSVFLGFMVLLCCLTIICLAVWYFNSTPSTPNHPEPVIAPLRQRRRRGR